MVTEEKMKEVSNKADWKVANGQTHVRQFQLDSYPHR